ncbi:MAG: CPBP family intramembrane metalloprotease, partial [Lachnoclostridium sp.]|nr:CPBP family intramembrane metalloprotease [Lachnoclostridium sp.]
MISKMILETKNGRTSNVGIECLLFFLVFIICEIVKSILIAIPIFFEMIKMINLEFREGMGANKTFQDIYDLSMDIISTPSVLIASLFSCTATIIGVVIYCHVIRKRPYSSMGFVKKNALRDYLIGMFWGILLLSSLHVVLYAFGYIEHIQYNGFNFLLILYFVGFILQSASEEVLLRGYLMNSAAARSNIPVSVILNSGIFTALHLFNPGITTLSILNIFIFGVVFSLVFLLSDNIWMASGLHFFWNFSL